MTMLYIKASLCFEWNQQKAVAVFFWMFKITVTGFRKVQIRCILSPNGLWWGKQLHRKHITFEYVIDHTTLSIFSLLTVVLTSSFTGSQHNVGKNHCFLLSTKLHCEVKFPLQLKVAGPSSVADVVNCMTEQTCHFLQHSYDKSRRMLKVSSCAARSSLSSIEIAVLEATISPPTPAFCLQQWPLLGASDTVISKSRVIGCRTGFTGDIFKCLSAIRWLVLCNMSGF